MTRTILAVDCSQREASIVLSRGPLVYARSFEPLKDSTREQFWDVLRELCLEACVEPWELEAVAVAVGPGGFTGLRVSIAFAKAVALAREIPALALGSASVFAASDAARGGRGPWLVALASKSGSAWCARVTRGDDGSFVEEAGAVVDAAAFLPRVSSVTALRGVVLTDEHFDPALTLVAAQTQAMVRVLSVDPCALAALAQQALSRGAESHASALSPIYAREPEAVTKWRELHKPKS